MTTLKNLGEIGNKMKDACVRRQAEDGHTTPLMSGENLSEALIGPGQEHNIDPRVISDFFAGLEQLCSAIIEDDMFGYYTGPDSDKQPRETTDAHILIGRMIWAFGKQLEYHEKNLMENTRRMKIAAERASCGEIDMQRLAHLERFGDVSEKSIDFWEYLIDELKASHQTVTGRPYRHGSKNAPVNQEAAKSLVASINEIVARRESRKTSRAS